MSEYSSLKATINANIKANNNQEITGSIMNSVLNAMVNSLGAGYQFIGLATPTNPGSAQTPDYKCFYIATTPGTYTNLGGLAVADGEVAILKYDTSWTKEVTGIASADKLNQLDQQINNKEIDFSKVDIYAGFIGPNGLWNTAWSYVHTIIDVSNYSKVKIIGNSLLTTYYTFLKSYDTSTTPSYANGYSGRVEIKSQELLEVDIPNDAKYLYIFLGSRADKEQIPQKVTLEAQIPLEFEKIEFATMRNYVLLTNKKTLAEQLIEPNTVYLVSDIHNENGNIIQLPSNCILKGNGGYINNCTLLANNNNIIDGINFTYNKGATSVKIYDTDGGAAYNSMAIYIHEVTNVIVKNCIFETDVFVKQSGNYYIASYSHDIETSNIEIFNCTFNNIGIAIWSNTSYVKIHDNNFKNSVSSIDVEMRIDSEWRDKVIPHNIYIYQNKLKCVIGDNVSYLGLSNIWLSGVENIYIYNNYIETLASCLTIYCSDAGAWLANIYVKNNIFIKEDYAYSEDYLGIVLVMGKSFVYPSQTELYGQDIQIVDNVFSAVSKQYPTVALSIKFANYISVRGNSFVNFIRGIEITDSISGYTRKSSLAYIQNNVIRCSVPIFVEDNIKYVSISENMFSNYGVNEEPMMDLRDFHTTTAFITNNTISDKLNGTNPVCLFDITNSENITIVGNFNDSGIPLTN